MSCTFQRSLFVAVVVVTGFLCIDPVIANVDCMTQLIAVAPNLQVQLKADNKVDYKRLCHTYKTLAETCPFQPNDKQAFQQAYRDICESDKIKKWLASSSRSSSEHVGKLSLLCIAFILAFRT